MNSNLNINQSLQPATQNKNIQKQKIISNLLSQNDLSQKYYGECQQLSIIQQKFNIFQVQKQLAIRDIESEFELLRALTETKKHKLKLRNNTILQNKKNRYPEQSIYEHSRVVLEYETINISEVFEEQEQQLVTKIAQNNIKQRIKNSNDSYINANYVKYNGEQNKIIITQAPIQSTVKDFQRMLIEEEVSCLVMLCNLMEGNKVRCFDYLKHCERLSHEGSNDALEISTVTIAIDQQSFIKGSGEDQSLMKGQGEDENSLNQDTSQSKKKIYQYTHLFYKEWPDRGIPQDIALVHQLVTEILKHKNVIIHCSAGLGRSGVIAVILSILQDLQSNSNLISVFGQTRKLRQNRYGAVQNNEQYKFIYKYFCYWVKNRHH